MVGEKYNMKLEEIVKEKIENKINENGFEIEYVEFVKEGENNIFRVVLDKADSTVNIDDCEKISRLIEDDVDKLISKEYILEVSSPGVERQLKNINLYQKYTGNKIFVKLFKKISQGKELVGNLKNVDIEEKVITLELETNEVIKLEISQISSAHTVYDFDATLKEKKPVNLNKLNKFNKK